MELSAGRIEGPLFLLGAAIQQRPAVLVNDLAQQPVCRPPSQRGFVVEVADDLSAQDPEIVDMPADGLLGKPG
jgi:hypothetical protein